MYNGDYVNTYFGDRYSSSGSSGSYGYSGTNHVASSANLNRVSRDIAQGYNQNMQIIDLYMQQGNVNQALKMYDSLFDSVKGTAEGYGYNLSDGQITSILNQAYANATGNSFVASVDKETHSPFLTGLLEGIPIVGLFVNGKSNAEALSKVAGTKTRFADKLAEWAGTLAAPIAAGAAIGACCAGVGAVPGALIGGAYGIVSGTLKCLIK